MSKSNHAASCMILVRTATPEDAAAIAALSGELGYPSDTAQMRSRLIRLQASAADCVALAEEPGEPPFGWIHVARRITLEDGEIGEILGLVVGAAARRHGVGRRLVESAEQWCRGQRLFTLRVRSNVLRAAAHEFYPALGFSRAKSQHVYAKALGEDASGR